MASIASFFPPGFSILGGIPIKDQDYAACIIFTLAYIAATPVVIWRLYNRDSRCLTLIRPALFIQARVITYIIRGIISQGHYSTGLFIAEQILLLCGFVMLCEPLLDLLDYHINRFTPPTDKRTRTTTILRLLKLALMVALGLGVYAGTKFGDLNNASSKSTVQTCRDANAIICAIITALVGMVVLVGQVKRSLPIGPTIYILSASLLLTIPGIYKIFIYETSHPPSPTHQGTKTAFYILTSLPELIVAVMYIAVNLNVVFGIPEFRRRAKEFKDSEGGTGIPLALVSDGYQMQSSYA